MVYSIKAVLHPKADKERLHKVNIQVIYQRKKAYAPTVVRVPISNFDDGVIVKHIHKGSLNERLNKQKHDIEARLLAAINKNANVSKEDLSKIAKGTTKQLEKIDTYIDECLVQFKGKYSDGRLKQFKVLQGKLESFHRNVTFGEITATWMQKFETWLRTNKHKRNLEDVSEMSHNAIVSKMSTIRSILHKAEVDGLYDTKSFAGYKFPVYKQGKPNHITEAEMKDFHDVAAASKNDAHKLAGYYFLLSCYAGYRISDLKTFDYNSMVHNGRIILRAKKNGEIVSIAIHNRLQVVLDFVHDKPLYIAEQTMRKHVKAIASLAGIKPIKVHDGRHSFAMMLMDNGFSIDEVAELLGDTPAVARIYARISNTLMDKKIKERLNKPHQKADQPPGEAER